MRLPLIICYCFFTSFVFSQDFNIISFGATADGITLNTTSIQSAIDAAHKAGGGKVIIPSGRFLTGSIVLKSHVELHLVRQAVLLGSTEPENYIKINRWLSLILADQQNNISITGQGVIDGQGRKLALHIDSLFYAGKLDSASYNFVEMRPTHYVRPQLIEFVNCKNILVENVKLKNAACWVQTYDQCVNVVIDRVKVDSDAYWNNDGIDIQDCKNVRITNCLVNASDDGICLKSQSLRHLCDSIYIGNCVVRSSASAIKFGTVSHGGFKNVVIENIKVYDTFRSAIAIECVDGGVLENVVVNKIKATNTGNAIFIRLGDRNAGKPPGTLKNVTIKNLKADISFRRPDYEYEIQGPDLPFFHNIFPSSITGIPGGHIENVVLENITIKFPGRGNNGLANMPLSRLDDVAEKISSYPEYSMFGELPAWGLYVRHMNGLTLKNVKLSIIRPDYRPAIIFDDVTGLALQSVIIKGDTKPHQIILSNTRNTIIENEKAVLKLK